MTSKLEKAMTTSPNKIQEKLANNRISKTNAINQLVLILDNINDDNVRKECIELLQDIDDTSQNMFKILEDLLITDPNKKIRKIAASTINKKYSKKALEPLLWALKYEDSYDCLIAVLNSLADKNHNLIKSHILEKIRNIDRKYEFELISKSDEIKFLYYTSRDLIEVLVNISSLIFLKLKFPLLRYILTDGLVRELDFSAVDNKIIRWYDREQMLDVSEIKGLRRLKKLKKIELFSSEWALTNELNLNCQTTLIQTINNLSSVKEIFIIGANKILNQDFKVSVGEEIENIQISKLERVMLNFLSISFLKKKYPQLTYKLEDGEINELIFEGIKLVTLKPCLRFLTSLKHLNLRKCSLYTIPDYFTKFHQLEYLNLEWNNLKVIPPFLKNLPRLNYLNVDYNRVK